MLWNVIEVSDGFVTLIFVHYWFSLLWGIFGFHYSSRKGQKKKWDAVTRKRNKHSNAKMKMIIIVKKKEPFGMLLVNKLLNLKTRPNVEMQDRLLCIFIPQISLFLLCIFLLLHQLLEQVVQVCSSQYPQNPFRFWPQPWPEGIQPKELQFPWLHSFGNFIHQGVLRKTLRSPAKSPFSEYTREIIEKMKLKEKSHHQKQKLYHQKQKFRQDVIIIWNYGEQICSQW